MEQSIVYIRYLSVDNKRLENDIILTKFRYRNRAIIEVKLEVRREIDYAIFGKLKSEEQSTSWRCLETPFSVVWNSVEIQKRMFVVHSANPSGNWPGVTREFQYPLLWPCPCGAQGNPVKLNQGGFRPFVRRKAAGQLLLHVCIHVILPSNDSHLNVIDSKTTYTFVCCHFNKRGTYTFF